MFMFTRYHLEMKYGQTEVRLTDRHTDIQHENKIAQDMTVAGYKKDANILDH